MGFQGLANLIPADIGTVEFQFFANFMVEGLLEISCPNFATFVKDCLGFSTEGFALHVLHHKITFEAVACSDIFFGEGDKVIDDAPFFAIPFKVISAGGEI